MNSLIVEEKVVQTKQLQKQVKEVPCLCNVLLFLNIFLYMLSETQKQQQ